MWSRRELKERGKLTFKRLPNNDNIEVISLSMLFNFISHPFIYHFK